MIILKYNYSFVSYMCKNVPQAALKSWTEEIYLPHFNFFIHASGIFLKEVTLVSPPFLVHAFHYWMDCHENRSRIL